MFVAKTVVDVHVPSSAHRSLIQQQQTQNINIWTFVRFIEIYYTTVVIAMRLRLRTLRRIVYTFLLRILYYYYYYINLGMCTTRNFREYRGEIIYKIINYVRLHAGYFMIMCLLLFFLFYDIIFVKRIYIIICLCSYRYSSRTNCIRTQKKNKLYFLGQYKYIKRKNWK